MLPAGLIEYLHRESRTNSSMLLRRGARENVQLSTSSRGFQLWTDLKDLPNAFGEDEHK